MGTCHISIKHISLREYNENLFVKFDIYDSLYMTLHWFTNLPGKKSVNEFSQLLRNYHKRECVKTMNCSAGWLVSCYITKSRGVQCYAFTGRAHPAPCCVVCCHESHDEKGAGGRESVTTLNSLFNVGLGESEMTTLNTDLR